MSKAINTSIKIYQEQLAQGDIQKAYVTLTKYIAELKTLMPSQYQTGNISFGYLDYTYFPFFNAQLRDKKLRFGLVLNHEQMQIELWLMGQNAAVQTEYWQRLKETKWNRGRISMPTYAVLVTCLENNLDFEQKDRMTATIINRALREAAAIQEVVMA